MAADPPLTLGTAGHIDHGKTALVAALTGTDTDRLPEERRRGISITLGYARLRLPSGRELSVVDAPGHERFVRTMVAGATGIDCFLATVAADDGVMPQTREHAAVLRALDVGRGVVAVTKADLADPARAAGEAAALFGGAEVVAVSARTGAGLDDLRAALDRLAARTPSRAAAAPTAVNVDSLSVAHSETTLAGARLHVDRVFTVRGAGTVVTGTLWSGALGRGDEVTLLPSGRRARVRGVQVHDADVGRAAAGQRVAVNLAAVGRDEVARGDVVVAGVASRGPRLVAPDDGSGGDRRERPAGRPSRAPPPTRGDLPVATYRVAARLDCSPPARVMVHHGTRESAARAVALGDGLWQLRLQDPIVALAGDRLVVRAIAPPDTLGGGTVTDVSPPRSRTDAADADGRRDGPAADAAGSGRVTPVPATPTRPDAGAAGDPGAEAAVLQTLRAAGLDPPHDDDLDPDGGTLAALRERGALVRLGREHHLAADVYADARDRVVGLLEAEGAVTLARVRDALGSSRRTVQALLERLDADRVTLRRGDERVLRRRAG